VWCGELPLKTVFPTLFTIACAKEAWVEENMAIVDSAIHWNVYLFDQFMIENWKRCRDFLNCCIPNKLCMEGWIKFVGFTQRERIFR
jgi:hypothetical protein